MQLSDYLELLPYDIAFWISGLKEPNCPFETQGDMSLEVSFKLRALAIILLLVEGETDIFYHNLIRSGILREEYLTRCIREQHLDDHHYASARLRPFFDTVAAGDRALAMRIAAASPLLHRREQEYEDDYCYAQALHRLVQPTPPEHEILPLLTQFEAALEGAPSARLAVCHALTARDQAAFNQAFDDLLDERSEEIKKDIARGQLEDACVVADRRVFIEGLALLRIATSRGLATKPDYPLCPSLARVAMREPFPGE